MRALLYARYSTTLQSSLSIDDQLRVCADLCARQGWTVAGQHCDAAISGAVRDRPGLNALLSDMTTLAASPGGGGVVIVAESLDRLSRDQEDIAAIHKAVLYADARIWTLSEGEVGELHIGLRGTMAAMVRKDTADKVRRGLTGRALAGMNPGGMAYGYRKVARFDDRGEPVRGLRMIDEDQAAVIRRIFAEFAQGLSVRTIVARLNAEGVPAPTDGRWRLSTVHGDPKRRNGILRNDLYRGQLVYNRTRRIRHPVTRRREIRLNPESEWIRVDAPDLRIVGDELWESAHRVLRRYSGAIARVGVRPRERRPQKLLSGKAFCGICGATWRIVSGGRRMGGRWGCAAHHDGRSCSNGRTITTESFERRVLKGLSEKLLDPELVAAYVEEYRRTWAELAAGARKDRRQLERRRADAEARIERYVRALGDGKLDVDTVAVAVNEAKAERDRAEAELREIDAEKVVALHPGLADRYRRRAADLVDSLGRDDAIAAREAVRALIDRIVVTPKAGTIGTDIEVHGLLSSAVAIAGGKLPECTVALVPLVRLERTLRLGTRF